jgi:hypothetical protein
MYFTYGSHPGLPPHIALSWASQPSRSTTRLAVRTHLVLVDEQVLVGIPTGHDNLADEAADALLEIRGVGRIEEQPVLFWDLAGFPPSAGNEQLGDLPGSGVVAHDDPVDLGGLVGGCRRLDEGVQGAAGVQEVKVLRCGH